MLHHAAPWRTRGTAIITDAENVHWTRSLADYRLDMYAGVLRMEWLCALSNTSESGCRVFFGFLLCARSPQALGKSMICLYDMLHVTTFLHSHVLVAGFCIIDMFVVIMIRALLQSPLNLAQHQLLKSICTTAHRSASNENIERSPAQVGAGPCPARPHCTVTTVL